MKETYYTVEQIAEMLSIHPKTIQRYIREGKLRAAKIGKGWRVTGHDLSAFAENLPQSRRRARRTTCAFPPSPTSACRGGTRRSGS